MFDWSGVARFVQQVDGLWQHCEIRAQICRRFDPVCRVAQYRLQVGILVLESDCRYRFLVHSTCEPTSERLDEDASMRPD